MAELPEILTDSPAELLLMRARDERATAAENVERAEREERNAAFHRDRADICLKTAEKFEKAAASLRETDNG